MNLSEMRRILAAGDLRLTKSLGQNFLHDGNQLRRIVATADLKPGDKILEIGPGLGPLTELLITQPVEVLALEIDNRLCEYVRQRFSGMANLVVEKTDALEWLRKEPRDFRDWKLVANLPYSVASPLLVELAQSPQGPKRMVATLQLEVVKRLVAKADSEDYGVLTLLVQMDYQPGEWFKIPASCFFPPPEVDSACIVLLRRPEPLVTESERKALIRLIKLGFSQRRKMLMKLLKQEWPTAQLERAFASLSLSPQSRAETLSLEQFIRLIRQLNAPS